MKGVLSAICRGSLRIEIVEVSSHGILGHIPDLTAGLSNDNGPIGRIGVLHGPILNRAAPGRRVIWFELELDRLTQAANPDFCILWSTGRGFAALHRSGNNAIMWFCGHGAKCSENAPRTVRYRSRLNDTIVLIKSSARIQRQRENSG